MYPLGDDRLAALTPGSDLNVACKNSLGSWAGRAVEIITGVERRRRWRLDEKLQIVAEVEQPGACFAQIARRYDVSRGLLWSWRRQARNGGKRPA